MQDILNGEKVKLTALNPDDIAVITRWYHDSVFIRLLDATPAYPRPQSHWRKSFEERYQEKDTFIFGIRPLNGDDLLGWIEIDGILWAHRVCWIGIGIGDPNQRGKGYGYDAMRLALRFIFSELNLYRVQLTVFGYNTRAITLYERLGFQREGTYRRFMERDGQRYDMFLYGLLRDEWQ